MNNTKFCIYIPDEPTGKRVKEIADKNKVNPFNYDFEKKVGWLFTYNSNEGGFYKGYSNCRRPELDPDILSLSEFESLYTKEIKHYKCIKAIYGDVTLVGMPFIKKPNNGGGYCNYYTPEDRPNAQHTPQEFVENNTEYFEPVYKEEEKVVICGGREYKLSVFSKVDIEEIKNELFCLQKSYNFPESTTISELKNLVDQFNPGK
jgi:hypothetical protein